MKSEKTVSPLEAHLGYWMRFVSNHVSQSFARKLEAEGVTVAEWVALRELLTAGEIAPSALAARMGVTRGAMTKIVDKLLAGALVTRVMETGDKRYQRLALTSRGRALVPKLARIADTNDAEAFGHLSKRDREALRALLVGLVEHHGLLEIPTE